MSSSNSTAPSSADGGSSNAESERASLRSPSPRTLSRRKHSPRSNRKTDEKSEQRERRTERHKPREGSRREGKDGRKRRSARGDEGSASSSSSSSAGKKDYDIVTHGAVSFIRDKNGEMSQFYKDRRGSVGSTESQSGDSTPQKVKSPLEQEDDEEEDSR